MAAHRIKLTAHVKGFKKCIGVTATGKRKIWWLGHDARQAQTWAAIIMGEWSLVTAHGGNRWPVEALARIELERHGKKPSKAAAAKQTKPAATVAIVNGFTTEQAIEAFKATVESSHATSQGWRIRQGQRIDKLVDDGALPDMPLSAVNASTLTALVNHYTALPISKRTGKPISVAYCADMVATAHSFFDWLTDSEVYEWTPCKGYARIFKVKRRAMERQARFRHTSNGVSTFTLDELVTLYAKANDQQRLYLLLGLNCGFAAGELATLRKCEVMGNGKAWRIVRERSKTGVLGEWSLWSETAKLLRQRMEATPDNADGLAMLTKWDKPLVYYSFDTRTDSVYQTWAKLLMACPSVRRLSFKYLRKTGADMLRKLSDKDTSETYLAHAERSMARHYSNPDYAKVDIALATLRSNLEPMFSVIKKSKAKAA